MQRLNFFRISIISLGAIILLFNSSVRNYVSAGQDDDQQLRIILMTLSRNMMTFSRSLPDLVCQEELDQEITSASGKIEESKIIKSALTGRQTKRQTNAGTINDFEERREIQSINGKKPAATSESKQDESKSPGLPPPFLSGA